MNQSLQKEIFPLVPLGESSTFQTRIISVSNQKGGVGKTTTTINLSTALAAVGKKVLVVDLDPQGNASTGLGIDRANRTNGTYEVLFGECEIDQAASSSRVPNLFVIPASIHLSGAEIELVDARHRESRMKEALSKSCGGYDYVLFDCPPSLNLLTLNALVASDSVLVPLQCEFFALEGLSHLVKTIERVRASFNDRLELMGVVLTMYDRRNNLSTQVSDNVRAHFGDKVFETVIPRNVRISEAPSFGLPAIVYDMKCNGSQAYIQLAKELLKREKALKSKRGIAA
ncbi:MAG: ParA family protein [Alphaproteobacteria bacterium]|nr:ParA family protein [Alphaproteobacteria bacterium]MCK5659481.1 ParA family protein [Alphaproteobacteria bacterium]